MFKLLNKKYLSAFLAFLSLSSAGSSLQAWGGDCCAPSDCCSGGKIYIGGFGGELWSNKVKLRQTGVAFFSEVTSIGPLSVDARGRSREHNSGFGGAQIGYAMAPICLGCSGFSITPAAEIEAFWYSKKMKGDDLASIISILEEHDFVDKFPTNVGVYLVNGVVNLNSCFLGGLSPYIGGGVGAADLSIHKADSLQVNPVEAGVNHFNSKRNDSAWAFAAQAKVGLGYNIFKWVRIFAEYRFLFIDSTRFNFGSTVYPDHVPTTTWDVDVGRMWHNSFAVGLQFIL